jgi:galactokinase
VTTSFLATFGHRPEGIWAAPGRLNVIGEFTDYNDGFVLPLAIRAVTRAAISRRADDVLRVASAAPQATADPVVAVRIDELEPVAGRWADYALGVAWALTQAGHHLSGVDVFIDGEVPIGAGLSSSAALECAVGLALRDLFAPSVTRLELAELAQRAENAFVGVPSGSMDQTASLCCTAGHVLLLDSRSREIDQLRFDLAGAGLELLVLDTSVRHRLASSAYADRRAACEAAARLLGLPALRDASPSDLHRIADDDIRRRARHVVSENARVLQVAKLLRAGRLIEIGPVLTASHRSLRDDFEASSAELDLAVDAALGAGALGARMTGGGFGGCAIALVHSHDAPAVAAAVAAAFAGAGWEAPHVFPEVPSGGARRLA